MDKEELISRLTLVIKQLEEMHTEIVVDAARRGIEPKYLRTQFGEPVVVQIFVAQANALSALANLQGA